MYKVIVHFATSYEPRAVASFTTLSAAEREARRYLGADARGIWIESPDGLRTCVR